MITLNQISALILVVVFGYLELTAQSGFNRLQVTSPSSIAGSYDIEAGGFGNNEIDSLSGVLRLIVDDTEPTSDACTEAINDLSGTIAFVDRGMCAFVDKAAHAQSAGAIAMLVCNNVPSDGAFVMGGDAPDITIPIAMATYEDCQTIRVELENGIQVSLDYYIAPCVPECAVFDFPSNTVWGQNGEGTFACGLGDWTTQGITNDSTLWKWDKDTRPVGQSGAPRNVESATECNGAAQMDFCDYNFNSINGPHVDIVFSSDLISPTIDLTNIATPVLHFTHYLCTLSENQEIAFITYSRDNGDTWLDTVPILTKNYIHIDSPFVAFETETVKLSLCGEEIGNTDQFKVKFIADGNFYFWTIDDVYITDEPLTEIEASPFWHAGAPNFKTPTTQVDSILFMVNTNNTGNTDFNEVNYTATITKDGDELFATTQSMGALPKCNQIEGEVAPDQWSMQDEYGLYELTYTIDGTGEYQDTNQENNTVSSSFMVTEGTFSKMRTEEEAGIQYLVGHQHNSAYFSYANGYYIQESHRCRPLSLTTGFEVNNFNDFGFTTLTGEVREWVDDINGDGIVNLETETTLLAQGQLLIDPYQPMDLRRIKIDLNNNSGDFKLSTQYLAIIHVAALDPLDGPLLAPLSSGVINVNTGNADYLYRPTHFAFQEAGQVLGRPGSLADFFGKAGSPSDQEARNLNPDIGNSLSWYIDMEIYNCKIVNTVNIDETIDMTIFPNPATDAVTVDVNLTEVSKSVNVQIVDISGKIVANNNFTHVKNNALNINTTDLASGVYMINVFTDSGVKSERILIQK